MILTCPDCASRFSLDESALGTAGRRVRCSQCRHVWHAAPPAVEVEEGYEPPQPTTVRIAPPVDAPPIRPSLPPSSRAPRAPRRTGGAGLAWAALALVVILVLGGAVVAKDEILAAWPESERLYSAFGIVNPGAGSGLELRKVSWKRDMAENVPLLAIEGEVANASQNVRSVPKIRAAIVGKDGHELKSWVFAPPKLNLIPGESVPFRTELRNPPEGAERLTMIFASGS
jgi:predicted Zn finger-like uncharacterized protein